MSLGSVVIVVLAVVLLVTVALILRSRTPNPWPVIVVAMFTSGVAFTVGGGSGKETSGPSAATVTGAIAGLLSVAAAILALIPRSSEAPPARLPMLLASAGVVVGVVGLLVNQFAS
jgi:cytochrome c biogenesis factor